DRAADELRHAGLPVLHAAEDFAGERIERLARAVGGLVEHGNDKRIGGRTSIESGRNRRLISRLRNGRKAEAACATSTAASASSTAASGQRQRHIIGAIGERRCK